MIDMHSHILPGVDDGPGEIETALKILDIAVNDGIKTVVATPHDLNGVYRNNREKILQDVRGLREIVRKKNRDIDILPGSDTYMAAELLEELDKDNVMTLNNSGKFLFLELPSFFIPEQIKQQTFEIRLRGITPVITHPERNAVMMENPDILYELIRAGALVQITAGSVTGDFGRDARKNALRLLQLNMAHILATDAHNTSSRPPVLSKALRTVREEIGAKGAAKMVLDTPLSLINGTEPSVGEPLRKKKWR